MQPTLETDRVINKLKEAISFVDMIRQCDEFYLSIHETEDLPSEAFNIEHFTLNFDLLPFEKEFWQTCAGIEQIHYYKKIFEVKFHFLLEWRQEFDLSNKDFLKEFRNEISPLISFLLKENNNLNADDINKLNQRYYVITYKIIDYKSKIISLFDEWEKMANLSINLNKPNILNAADKSEINSKVSDTTTVSSKFRLAPNRKTDFLKIISSMYDARMFETEDGYIASSKQQLINEFGRLLNEDFSKYSAFLSQSKNVSEETFLKPFREIEQKAKDYFEK